MTEPKPCGIIFGGDGFAQITGKFEPITLTGGGDEMSICPICGHEVSMFPWLFEDVLCVSCKHCKKRWYIDDPDGKGEEIWKMVYKIEKEKQERWLNGE